MESKHRFPQSLENAHAFPTFPPPDDDHTYSKREKIIVPERVKYLTPITSHRRKAFSSAVPEACPGPKKGDTVARARPVRPFCRDLRPASHGRPGTPSNGRTTERQQSHSESGEGLTKARCEE